MALCIYPKEHEWRLIKEVPFERPAGGIEGYVREYYCIFCRTIVEDKKK